VQHRHLQARYRIAQPFAELLHVRLHALRQRLDLLDAQELEQLAELRLAGGR
jgi:hypothetical protein